MLTFTVRANVKGHSLARTIVWDLTGLLRARFHKRLGANCSFRRALQLLISTAGVTFYGLDFLRTDNASAP